MQVRFGEIAQLNLVEAPFLTKKDMQGTVRDCMELKIEAEQNSFEDLYTLFSNADNLKELKLIEEDAEYLHIDFSVFDSLSFNGQYFTVILGQLTAQEKLINDLIARVEALEK